MNQLSIVLQCDMTCCFFRAISVAKFPDHFHQLSVDENRGFSQEYEVHKKANCILFFLFYVFLFLYRTVKVCVYSCGGV